MELVFVYNRRDVFIKSNLNKFRKEGYIFVVVYGDDIKSFSGYVFKKEFEKLYY